MNNGVLQAAKCLYRITPWPSLRRLYYRFFCLLANGKRVRTSRDGMTFDLDLSEMGDLPIYLDIFEPEVATAIERHCGAGMVIFDIGANCGGHTLRFAKHAGSTGRVYAFEPVDYAYSKLLRNVKLNNFDNIFPVKVALSDRNLKNQEISYMASWAINGAARDRTCRADLISLDEWCDAHSIDRVDLIKLDVDGNEYDVISGARRLFKRFHPMVIMEVWGPNFRDDKKNPFSLLQSLGYRYFDINTSEELSMKELKSLVSSKDGILNETHFNVIVSASPAAS